MENQQNHSPAHLDPPPPTPLEFNQEALFLEFPLIYVNSRKLFEAHGQGLTVVRPEEGDFLIFTPTASRT